MRSPFASKHQTENGVSMPKKHLIFGIFAEKKIEMMVIGIAGGTGSGKTTVVQNILKKLNEEHICVLSQDNYYNDNHGLSMEEKEKVNYDHPSSIDFDLLTAHVKALKEGKSIEQPVYSFANHARTEQKIIIKPQKILIIEGILVFTHTPLLEEFDLKVFVEADPDERLIRRIRRDIQERGRDLEEVLNRYQATLKPMHETFIEPSKNHADIIVPNMRPNTAAVELLAHYIASTIHLKK